MRPTDPSADHDSAVTRAGTASGSWTFLSNHGHVLLCLAADPHQTLSTIAEQVGITSRGVQLILADLIRDGYVERTKVGRRNQYRVNTEGRLRHPLEAHHSIRDLITALGPPRRTSRAVRPSRGTA
ncbi:MarR family winged helix-turn-helix transcriptional regulator [Umezawaea sp.]|uniref:helix-turn-helix transcriptional regulator n=1 Tax=Umezawaea sp. TaxID=1955258 RepID=UPI002ED1B068